MAVDSKFLRWDLLVDDRCKSAMIKFRDRYPKHYENVIETLTWRANEVVGKKIFPLKGKKYRGAWEYKEEIPEGTFRLYYSFNWSERQVLIYYAGSKPQKAPSPPKAISAKGKVHTS